MKDNRVTKWIRRGMTLELSELWVRENSNTFMSGIYRNWSLDKLGSVMFSKITTSWYHQIAVGRGRLRDYLYKTNRSDTDLGRFGCNDIETVEHVVLRCPKLRTERKRIIAVCKEHDIHPTIKNVFSNPVVKVNVEMLLATVIHHN